MKINIKNISSHFVLIIVSILAIFPFVWLISTSFKGANENIFSYPPMLFPQDFTFDNYVGVWGKVDFLRYFLNSFIVAFFTVILNLLFSSMAAYFFCNFGNNYDTISSNYVTDLFDYTQIEFN